MASEPSSSATARSSTCNRGTWPLDRYFPELIEPIRAIGSPMPRFVLDGEIVIARDGGLSSNRCGVHPAASRVAMLAAETPSSFVAFDCLASGDQDLREAPLDDRRAALEAVMVDAPNRSC